MALQTDPPHRGDIGDEPAAPTCDFAGTLHPRGCKCGAVER